MGKIRITKRFTFEMAHALLGYDGLCKNIHGHSYVLWVTITGEPVNDSKNPKNGMLLDFSVLSKLIKEKIVTEFDHCLLLNSKSKSKKGVAPILPHEPEQLKYVDYQPTSENLLTDIAIRIEKLLPVEVKLHSLKLQETENSYAEWYREDNK